VRRIAGKVRNELREFDAEERSGAPGRAEPQPAAVARIATLADWPLILIDLYTEEGVIGRSY
jgi:hypothetical protein